MTAKTVLPRFPNDLQIDTRCGHHLSPYPTHSVHSETRKQRNLMQRLAKLNGYQPPRQTCCSHQITTLARTLDPDGDR